MALYVAVVWYVEITPEQAFRIIDGNSNMKKMCKNITPEAAARIRKICSSPYFIGFSKQKSMDRLCRRFGVSKEVISEIVADRED
jgi:hypothetical protein